MKNLSNNSFAYNSWFFAHINKICYNEIDHIQNNLHEYNFVSITPILPIEKNTVGFVIELEDDIIVSIRGVSDNNSIPSISCLKIWYHSELNKALVHSGFGKYTDIIWPIIKVILLLHGNKKIWFTGHSMGGSISKLLAFKAVSELSIQKKPNVFTYGSPRIIFILNNLNFEDISLTRWVNNIDIVSSSPSLIFGYAHHSEPYYINRFGNVVQYNQFEINLDRLKTYFMSPRKFTESHGLSRFLSALERYKYNIILPED